jgi:hypothetical protein
MTRRQTKTDAILAGALIFEPRVRVNSHTLARRRASLAHPAVGLARVVFMLTAQDSPLRKGKR